MVTQLKQQLLLKSSSSFLSPLFSQTACYAVNRKLINRLKIFPMTARTLFISTKPSITWEGIAGFSEKTNTLTGYSKNPKRSSELQRLILSTVPLSTVPNKKQAKTSTTVTKSLIKKSNPLNFTYRRGNKRIATLPKNTNLFCLISINRTKNNTHAVISNLFGENKTKWSISAGQFKLPGGRRKTRLSQRMVYKSCLEKALSFGYKFTVIHCKGTRGSKTKIFRFFGNFLSVLLIKDITGTPHNGCRPPKVRRV